MVEEWLPIKGYEGYYEVSNTGKVRSVERVIKRIVGKDLSINYYALITSLLKN